MTPPDRLFGLDAPEGLDDARRLKHVRDLVVAIAENTEAVVFCKDRAGRYTFVNQHCVDLWQLERDEIVGKTDFELFPEGVAQVLREHDLRVLETGEASWLEEEAVFHGRRRVYQSSKVPLFDENGGAYALCGVATEITEHRRASDLLREEARRLAILNELGRTLAGELDRERLVQAIVDTGRELSGARFGAFFYTVHDQGDTALVLYALSGADRSDFADFPLPRETAVFGPTLRGEGAVRIADVLEDPRYGKNDPYFGLPEGHLPVRSYLSVPVATRGGEVLGGLFFGHPEPGRFEQIHEDLMVSVASQASVALEAAQAYEDLQREIRRRAAIEEELKTANERKDEFLAFLGHELRNPIGTLQNCLEVMTLADGSEAADRARGMLGRQLTQLTRLVDDLLDLGRLATGQFRVTRSALDLAALGATVAEDFEDRFENLGLAFTVDLPEQPVWVDGDRARLGQAVGNLLDNAAKYTPRGGTVELSIRAEGPVAEIRVVDSGVGFVEDGEVDLFEPFEGSGGRDGRDGLGLGLAIVREIALRHDGDVTAGSPGRGEGSAFSLRLPRIEAPTEAPPLPATSHVRPARARKVLLIEDNPGFLRSLADVLEGWGHDVSCAVDGPAGIAAATESDYDIILCDIDLTAAMDGYLVARQLRALDRTRDVCIVAITGFGQDVDRERALNAGFDAHLVKPIDFTKLARLMDELGPEECGTDTDVPSGTRADVTAGR